MSFSICIVGCGGMSTYAHGPSCEKFAAEREDVELAACCDLDDEKAAAYQGKFGFARRYTDLVRMLEVEKPDAVALVAPPELTCELSCRILELGYPLIMEKPPGMTVDEIDRMIRAANSSGAPTRVAFNRRYTPLMARLRVQLEEFAPAAIQHVRYDFTRVGRTEPDFTTTAIHGADAVRFIAGSDYARVRFRYREFPDLGPTTANILMDCDLTSGATAHVGFCPVAGASGEVAAVHLHDFSFHLTLPVWNDFGSVGMLRRYDKEALTLEVSGSELCPSGERFIANGFYDENASFFDDLRAGRRPSGDLEDARQSVEIMQHIRERRAEYRAAAL